MNSDVIVIAGLGLLGLILGSFLNVVIARVPNGESVVRPSSRCPGCHTSIRVRDNIPIFSWIVLKGRCRVCEEPISLQYPLVELASAIAWTLIGWWATFGAGRWWVVPLLLAWASAAIALSVIDVRFHRLPNPIVYAMFPITVVGLGIASLGTTEPPWIAVAVGAVVWAVPLGFIYLVSSGRGMGLGDVKMAVPLGATVGWFGVPTAVIGLMAAFVLGAVVGIAVLLAQPRGKGSSVPGKRIAFGPFLLVGAAVAIAWGDSLWERYLSLAGLS